MARGECREAPDGIGHDCVRGLKKGLAGIAQALGTRPGTWVTICTGRMRCRRCRDRRLGRRLISSQPDTDAEEFDCGEVGVGALVVSCGDPSGVLELSEEALDQVAIAVEEGAEGGAGLPVPFGRNVGEGAGCGGPGPQCVAVIALVGQQHASRFQPVQKLVPDPGLPPSHKAVVAGGAGPVAVRNVRPRAARAKTPQNAVDHTPVVHPRHAAALLGQQRLNTRAYYQRQGGIPSLSQLFQGARGLWATLACSFCADRLAPIFRFACFRNASVDSKRAQAFLPKPLVLLVAGVGFEPTTFRL